MARVVIVGGGISGLALAWKLEQAAPDLSVQALESAGRLGGTIATATRDHFRVEEGPNGFLDTNPATLQLAREVGLGDRLVSASEEARRNRYLLLEGRLRRLPTSFYSFLRSDVLSWLGKVELLTERFRPRRKSFADESIESFARRRAGREVATTLADALVTGIYAGDPKRLSIQATFPRLAAFERDHGSVMRGMSAARRARAEADGDASPPGQRGQMWSFRDGLGELVAALASRLRTPPRTSAAVQRLRRREGGWLVEVAGAEPLLADVVVLACPAYQQAALLREIDPELAKPIGEIPYNRIAVVALGYRAGDVPRPLDGFGYLSPQREGRDVLGVQWCSTIFPGRAPDGMVLLRALCGGWQRAEMVDWPEHRLLAAVRAELSAALRIRAAPVFRHVVRWDRAIPQYHLGHLDRVAWIEARLERHPGLFLGGNAYRGVALNDCVENAGKLAARVAGWLRAGANGRAPAEDVLK